MSELRAGQCARMGMFKPEEAALGVAPEARHEDECLARQKSAGEPEAGFGICDQRRDRTSWKRPSWEMPADGWSTAGKKAGSDSRIVQARSRIDG